LVEIKKDSNELYDKVEAEMSSGLEIGQLKILMEYAEYYKRITLNQKVKIKMAEDYMNVCRQELIEAAKAKKMMEKLKAIDYKKYLYEEQKIEEKLIDDLVTFKEGNKA
jgi:flagellar export protein FliJ